MGPERDRGGYLLPLWAPALNDTFLSTTATGQRLDPLDLFARLLVEDGVAEVDVPVQARVRVVLVVVLLGRWARRGCAKLLCGHEVPLRGPCLGVCLHRRGSLRCQRLHCLIVGRVYLQFLCLLQK